MKSSKKMTDFSDLRLILPEAVQQEILRMEQQEKPSGRDGKGHDGKGKTVRLNIEKKGRNGKIVTVVTGLQHNPQTISEIAKILKGHCGAGGTVKGMLIEIQGDQREKIAGKLRDLNYVVKY